MPGSPASVGGQIHCTYQKGMEVEKRSGWYEKKAIEALDDSNELLDISLTMGALARAAVYAQLATAAAIQEAE